MAKVPGDDVSQQQAPGGNIPKLRELDNIPVAAVWYQLGLQLGVRPDALDVIESNYPRDTNMCKVKMFAEWLRSDTDPNYETLVKALAAIGKKSLAESVCIDQGIPLSVLPPMDAVNSRSDKFVPHVSTGVMVSTPSLSPPPDDRSTVTIALPEGNALEQVGTAPSLTPPVSPANIQEQLNITRKRKISPQIAKVMCGDDAREFSMSSSEAVSLLPELTLGSVSASDRGVLVPRDQGDTSSSFPYLDMGKLSKRDRLALQSKLLKDSDDIISEFSDLIHYTINSIVAIRVSVLKLHNRLSNLGAYRPTRDPVPLLRNQLNEIKRAEDVEEVFSILDDYYSFFNYGIIEKIIGWFGTQEDKERLETYTDHFKRFCKRRTFECPSNIFGRAVNEGKTNLVVKVEESWDPRDGSVESVLRLCNSLAEILEVESETLYLWRIDKGCVELLFQVPSFVEEDIFPLSEEQETSLVPIGVARLTCGSYSYVQPPEPLAAQMSASAESQVRQKHQVDLSTPPSFHDPSHDQHSTPQTIQLGTPSPPPPTALTATTQPLEHSTTLTSEVPLPQTPPPERTGQNPACFEFWLALLNAGVPHVVELIMSFVGLKTLEVAQRVSPEWWSIIEGLPIWKTEVKRNLETSPLWRDMFKKRGWHKYISQEIPHSVSINYQYRQLYRAVARDIHSLETNWTQGHYTLSKIETGSPVNCLQYNSKTIVSGHDDHTIKIWDKDTLQLLNTLTGHKDLVWCLQFNKEVIISGSSDTSFKVWDIQTGLIVNDLQHHKNTVRSLKFNKEFLITGSWDRTVAVWDFKSPTAITLRMVLKGHERSVYTVDLTDTYIISGSSDKSIKVWDSFSGRLLRTLLHSHHVWSLQCRGNVVISGCDDGTIRLWDLETGACITELKGHEDVICSVAFDDNRIVTGSYKTVKIWSMSAVLEPSSSTDTLNTTTLKEHSGRVYGVQFDNFEVVSGGLDGMIYLHKFIDPVSPHHILGH